MNMVDRLTALPTALVEHIIAFVQGSTRGPALFHVIEGPDFANHTRMRCEAGKCAVNAQRKTELAVGRPTADGLALSLSLITGARDNDTWNRRWRVGRPS